MESLPLQIALSVLKMSDDFLRMEDSSWVLCFRILNIKPTRSIASSFVIGPRCQQTNQPTLRTALAGYDRMRWCDSNSVSTSTCESWWEEGVSMLTPRLLSSAWWRRYSTSYQLLPTSGPAYGLKDASMPPHQCLSYSVNMVPAWDFHTLEVDTCQSFPIPLGTIKPWNRWWKGWEKEEQGVNDKCSSWEFLGPPLERLRGCPLLLSCDDQVCYGEPGSTPVLWWLGHPHRYPSSRKAPPQPPHPTITPTYKTLTFLPILKLKWLPTGGCYIYAL